MIPIRTETPVRRTPAANYVLLAGNVLVYLLVDVLGGPQARLFKDDYLMLHTQFPAVHEFFTYQFVHGDLMHLLGNMLFLWVFGNATNAKMGNAAYALFYLASGVFAAWGFALQQDADLLGASGSIAGVTAAYLVLFPRSRVTVLYWFYVIGTFELPALLMIGIKIILWDNVIAPSLAGAGNVATEAHLAGYVFGTLATLTLLMIRVLPRDQFDLLALLKRWNQRRAYKQLMSDPQQRARAQYGRVARPVAASPAVRAVEETRLDQIGDLRVRITGCLDRGESSAAAALYEQLVAVEPDQTLSARNQMAVAREFYGTGRTAQAAAAFERYLAAYGAGPEAPEVGLLLGIIYARDLQQYEAAERHLQQAEARLTDTARRAQCTEWLARARAALGKPAPGV